jgi:hypothetical protein
VTGQEVQPDCGGSSRLQAEAERTVATWFYQAARATRPLSFAVAGLPILRPWAPTRGSNVIIPVEAGTPRVSKRRAHYGVGRGGQSGVLEPRRFGAEVRRPSAWLA